LLRGLLHFRAGAVVVTVDGKPIIEGDLGLAEREVAVNPNLAPGERRRVLVEVLIQRQLLAAAAEQSKLQASKEFGERLSYARRRVLQELFLDKEAREAVSEAAPGGSMMTRPRLCWRRTRCASATS
jgi:peptidyl-prolyl cis-trans isomerase C